MFQNLTSSPLKICRTVRITSFLALVVLLPLSGYLWALQLNTFVIWLVSLVITISLFFALVLEGCSDWMEREVDKLSTLVQANESVISDLREEIREERRIAESLYVQSQALKSEVVSASLQH